MTGRVEGKMSFVTGAAQGLGEAIAYMLAKEGSKKNEEERKTKQSTRKRKLICLLRNHEDFLQKWIVLHPKRHYE